MEKASKTGISVKNACPQRKYMCKTHKPPLTKTPPYNPLQAASPGRRPFRLRRNRRAPPASAAPPPGLRPALPPAPSRKSPRPSPPPPLPAGAVPPLRLSGSCGLRPQAVSATPKQAGFARLGGSAAGPAARTAPCTIPQKPPAHGVSLRGRLFGGSSFLIFHKICGGIVRRLYGII